MTAGSKRDLIGLQRVGEVVATVLQEMQNALVAGMTTAELDAIGRQALARHGARPAPALFYGFPGATCISVNEEIAHGIPGKRRLRSGDLVNIDVSAELDGYVADTGASIPLGSVSAVAESLCEATRQALQDAVQTARAGRPMADLQQAITDVARRSGFAIIRNLAGHGVGRHIHESPSAVPDYSRRVDRRRFEKGMVLAIEPFLSTGAQVVHSAGDGWTLRMARGQRAAQYEHTIVVTEAEPIIVTQC